jgi:hypothetical protein
MLFLSSVKDLDPDSIEPVNQDLDQEWSRKKHTKFFEFSCGEELNVLSGGLVAFPGALW